MISANSFSPPSFCTTGASTDWYGGLLSKLFLTTTKTAISKNKTATMRRIVTVSRYPLVEVAALVLSPAAIDWTGVADEELDEPPPPPFMLTLRLIG